MIEPASVKCRLVLEFFPKVLQERLLAKEEIFDLGEYGLGESGSGLTLNFHQLAKQLDSLQMHEEFVLTAGDVSVSVKRTPGGVLIGNAQNGAYSRLIEAGLMDPDVDVREKSLGEIKTTSWPFLLEEENWQRIIRTRALTPFEIGQILRAKSAGPIRHFSRIKASTELDIDDLAPASPDYYRMLLPQPPEGRIFDGELLAEHLNSALQKNLGWGWWLVRASYVSNSLSPQCIMAAVSDEMFIKLATQNPAKTPYGRLAEVSVALARSSNGEMAAVVESRLSAMIKEVASREEDGPADLVGAFLRLTFARVVYLFPSADVVWRRMVSVTHANLLAEALCDQPWLANTVHQYCEQQLNDVLADVWDMREGAAWQMGFELASDLRLRSKARMEHLILTAASNGVSVSGYRIPDDQSPDHHGFRALLLSLVSPIDAPCTQRTRAEVGILSSSQAGIEQFATPWEDKNWNALWLLSMATLLGEDICSAIESELERARDVPLAGQRSQYLVVAARVAAAQQSRRLADAVARTCVAYGEQVSEAQDCSLLFQAIAIAGAALADEWGNWMKPFLLQLSYAVPKGQCSENLARSIDALKQLVPRSQLDLNQALAVARSAA